MKRIAGLACAAALILAGCGKSSPCRRSRCLAVSGDYLLRFDRDIDCPLWASQVQPTSIMTVQGSNGAVTITLRPALSGAPHVLTGTEFDSGTITAQENPQNPFLGVPFATLSGAFSRLPASSDPSALRFTGQLMLSGASSTAGIDGGPGGCAATIGMNAIQQLGTDGGP